MAKKKWIQSAHLKKGGLHRALGRPLEHKFTASELREAEKDARSELKFWSAEGNRQQAGRALHTLRMVLFAKNVRGFKKHSKRKKSYKGKS